MGLSVSLQDMEQIKAKTMRKNKERKKRKK